jgi:type III pantothenate kinase
VDIVAVDIGNTRARVGTFGQLDDGRVRLRALASVSYALLGAPGLYRNGTIAYASVNPRVDPRFVEAVRKATGRAPLRLVRDFAALVKNRYRSPASVGLDRLANVSAAWARTNGPCVVVDAGTAITLDAVNVRGEFVGGLIAPGMRLQARALRERTAQLPQVEPRRVTRAIARDTRAGIVAGISLGVEGLIRTSVERARRDLGRRTRVFGTGGDAALFRDLFDEVVPELTVEGIAISYVRAS